MNKSKIETSMEKLELEQLVTIFFFLLFNLVEATRMARMKGIKYNIFVVLMVDFFKNDRIISDFFMECRLQAIAIPL